MAKPVKKSPHNFYSMVTTIGIRALSHGKFVQFGVVGLCAIALLKIPGDKYLELVRMLLDAETFAIVGWVGFAIMSVASVALVRIVRRQYVAEIERISKEKTFLQEKLLHTDVNHSQMRITQP